MKEEIAELKAQNELLKSSNKNETFVEFEKLKQQITELHRKLSESEIKVKEGEIRLQRLEEVCTKKIQEFKEACQLLFGYKIDFADKLGKQYSFIT